MHVAHDRPSGCYKWTSPNAVLTITGAHLPINIHNTTLELIAKTTSFTSFISYKASTIINNM
jgi:hypothetical protein